jgi:hypothetical protein
MSFRDQPTTHYGSEAEEQAGLLKGWHKTPLSGLKRRLLALGLTLLGSSSTVLAPTKAELLAKTVSAVEQLHHLKPLAGSDRPWYTHK